MTCRYSQHFRATSFRALLQRVSTLFTSFCIRARFGPCLEGTDLSPYPSDNGQNSKHCFVVFQQLSTFAFALVYRT
jgi:hypothetical protein